MRRRAAPAAQTGDSLLGLVFSRGLAVLALTLVTALPAAAKEHGNGNGNGNGNGHGPPSHAQGPSADQGQSTAPPESAGPTPESQPGPPAGAGPDEGAPGAAPPAAAEPGASPSEPDKAKPKKSDPHADAASEPAPAPAPAEAESEPELTAPAESGRVESRSVGPADLSGPPSEDAGTRDRERTGRATSPRAGRDAPRTGGRDPLPRPADPVPAAVTFRQAVTSTEAVAASAASDVAGAASSAPRERAPSQAADTRSEPVTPAQPLPVRIVPRRVRQVVEVVPGEIWAALGALALLALALGASSWVTAIRARRLGRQREALLQEVGLLQAALLPSVPHDVPVSVAYRPADGAAAGGDFYEAFVLPDGRTAIVLGGMAGQGRDALARTTFIRYTLRAYLEAGLEPREVVKVGSAALADHVAGGFATVTVAVHDPETGRFTYANAGHAPPLVVGSDDPYEPVTACSAPPVGVGAPTGFRQTTFTLTAGSRACLYTDGVPEARVDGGLLGVAGLEQLLDELPAEAGAEDLLESVAETADEITGDMAVCLLRAPAGAPVSGPRVEELEVDELEVGNSLEHFLRACRVPLAEVPGILREAGEAARHEGAATVRVRLNDFRPGVDVVPGNLVRLDERRRAARL